MNGARDEDEDEDEDWDDEEADLGDDTDVEPTVPCPYCRRDILEDSPVEVAPAVHVMGMMSRVTPTTSRGNEP